MWVRIRANLRDLGANFGGQCEREASAEMAVSAELVLPSQDAPRLSFSLLSPVVVFFFCFFAFCFFAFCFFCPFAFFLLSLLFPIYPVAWVSHLGAGGGKAQGNQSPPTRQVVPPNKNTKNRKKKKRIREKERRKKKKNKTKKNESESENENESESES